MARRITFVKPDGSECTTRSGEKPTAARAATRLLQPASRNRRNATAIAKALGIGRANVYRVLEAR
jgi:transcriptional regulator of acetoin/glycerol metabolism